MSLMPTPLNLGKDKQLTIGNLLQQAKLSEEEPEGMPRAERNVLGFPLPSWQRAAKWSDDQCIRFMESAWLKLPIGSYVVNALDWLSDGSPHPLAGLLIDGQQRLRAFERYFDGQYPVFGYYWEDLPLAEQRKFLRRPMLSHELSIWNEGELRDLYNRLNFGGTAHLPEEKA